MLKQTLRIIGAITAKDITDAIRNRATLSVILGTLVLMLSSSAIPLLTSLDRTPTALVVDPGRSATVRALTTRADFRLRIADSEDAMRVAIGGNSRLILGLVIPTGFAEVAAEGEPITLPGYVAHWAEAREARALVEYFETQLSDATGVAVTIDLAGHALYPSPKVFGSHTMAASAAGMVILAVGLALAANLLTEEIDAHTLEALLVSPAGYGHIVAAKTLTGLFYCACATAVVFLIDMRWYVHWGLALLAALLGSTFVVLLGLLLGSVIGSTLNANIWVGLAAVVVLVPGFAGSLISENAAPVLRGIMTWMPSGAMNALLVDAMLGDIGPAIWGPPLGRLAGGVAVTAALLAWRVRRVERRA